MNNYVPQMASIVERVNKRPRLTQCVQMLNEEEFAFPVLASIYDEVDRIIVIEGAVANNRRCTPDGHSLDRTREILDDFKANHDPDKKLTIISINKPWSSLEEMKQAFLDVSIPGDWIIINDADELYLPEDIVRVRKAIDLYPHLCEIIPTFLHYYGDYNHVAVPGPEWNCQHQRIFKLQRGMKYLSHPVVVDSDGHCTYFSPHYQHRRGVPRNPIFIHHYGYARSNMDEIMKAKQEYYERELAAHGAANKKFDQKTKDWFDGTEPVLTYDDVQPISSHETKKGLNVVGDWRNDPFYSKVLAGEEYGNIWLTMTRKARPYMQHYHNGVEV